VTGRRESGDTTVSLIFWARRSSKSLLYNDTHFLFWCQFMFLSF